MLMQSTVDLVFQTREATNESFEPLINIVTRLTIMDASRASRAATSRFEWNPYFSASFLKIRVHMRAQTLVYNQLAMCMFTKHISHGTKDTQHGKSAIGKTVMQVNAYPQLAASLPWSSVKICSIILLKPGSFVSESTRVPSSIEAVSMRNFPA